MDVLNQLFSTLSVKAEVFHNGQYCGNWAIDTSGSHYISFHVVSHGRCFVTSGANGDKVDTMETGDIILFPRDAKHCLSNDPDFKPAVNGSESVTFDDGIIETGTGLICGYFAHSHPFMDQLMAHLPDYILLKRSEFENQSLGLLIKALLDESVEQSKGSTFILARISEAILASLLREPLSGEQGLLAAIVHPKLSKAIQAIHNKPDERWTIDVLAEVAHMSRAGFADLFRQVVGRSVMDYVTQWRLSLAYRMLADEQASTLQAALACGYDNESSFSKAFKRELGVTPGAVRKGDARLAP